MHLSADSVLEWNKGTATTHHLDLQLALKATGVFTTRDPVLELATRTGTIRQELVGLLLRDHIPKMLAETGMDQSLPGRLKTKMTTEWNAKWKVAGTPSSSSLDSRMTVAIEITSDRPVSAIQALANSRAVLADTIAEHVIAAFKQKLLGVTSTRSESEVELTSGGLDAYRHRETGPGPEAN